MEQENITSKELIRDQIKIVYFLLHPKNWRAGFPWNTSGNSKHFYEVLKY